ncbi:MAG: tspO [Bacillota bacterium]|jgi:tryptophan-rich sensory protein|nr:tspO [Bacillota bacterium]
MKNLKALIISILISVGVGTLAGFLTMNSMEAYDAVSKPDLVPPNWVFPIVWTILYILMGISAYLVYVSESPYRNSALRIYAIQLAMNFLWSIIFFNLQMYLLAFIWLLLLVVMIVFMILSFYQVNKTAAYLQIPYLLWVLFAGYLNLSIYLMNR